MNLTKALMLLGKYDKRTENAISARMYPFHDGSVTLTVKYGQDSLIVPAEDAERMCPSELHKTVHSDGTVTYRLQKDEFSYFVDDDSVIPFYMARVRGEAPDGLPVRFRRYFNADTGREIEGKRHENDRD